MIGWPRKPNLLPEVQTEFERRGVDSVRSLLDPFRDGGTGRDTLYKFGDACVRRGEVEEWLKWKASKEACWIKVGALAAAASLLVALR